jgi:tetratricopeptide (TPR) repeat protein
MRANTASTAKEFRDDIMSGREKTMNASDWEKLYAEYMYSSLTSEVTKGIEALRKITKAYPYAARAQYDLAFAYNANNEFGRSKEAYQKATELNPSWGAGFTGLVTSYLFNEPKDLKKAELYAMKVLELEPKVAGSYVLLGDVYRAQNDMMKARENYARSVELDPSDPSAYYKLGHANVYLGNYDEYDEARQNYANAGTKDVRPTMSENLNAFTYLYAGDHKKAIGYLLNAAAKRKSQGGDMHIMQTDEYNMLIGAYRIAEHNGEVETMKELLPQINELNTDINKVIGTKEAVIWSEASRLSEKAELALALGNTSEASMLAEKMKNSVTPLKDDRRFENYHLLKAKIDLKEKKFESAADHLKKADPNSMLPKYYMAKAMEGMGKPDKAMKLYKEISEYNFNNIDNALIRKEVKDKIKM